MAQKHTDVYFYESPTEEYNDLYYFYGDHCTEYSSPGVPVRYGYTFNGWYTAVQGGVQVFDATAEPVLGNAYWNADGYWCCTDTRVNFYAQWTINKYTLNLECKLDGVVVSNTNPVIARFQKYENDIPSTPQPVTDIYNSILEHGTPYRIEITYVNSDYECISEPVVEGIITEDTVITYSFTELGVCKIHNGSEFEDYGVYIKDGEKFSPYVPYVHDGTEWKKC